MKKAAVPGVGYPGSMIRKKGLISPGLFFALCVAAAFLCAALIVSCESVSDLPAEQTETPFREMPSAYAAPSEAEIPEKQPTEDEDAEETDLLLLVNAEHPLPEGYVPPSLTPLNGSDLFSVKEPNTRVTEETARALIVMLTAAHGDGLTLWQVSEGYRSRAEQQAVWDRTYEKYRTVNGLSEKKALQATKRRVASPGCSEHETGLALDITVPGQSFRLTEQCQWLAAHCAEYGFVIRYTEDKEAVTGITAEPWHIRYVGVDAAMEMTEKGLCLEEYVSAIR